MKSMVSAVAVLFAFLLVFLMFAAVPSYAQADGGASNVLTDLKKDSAFDVKHYPAVTDDYSLKMIQIAESTDNELLVYVYQPSGSAKNLIASSINVSVTINDAISFHNYKLRLQSFDGVFYKYAVVGFKVAKEPTRFYVISSIYRPFDKTLDDEAEHGNTVTEVNYPVDKQYAFGTVNGLPFSNVIDIQTITVTDKFVGFVRYKDGFSLAPGACDSHFVAFNTDKPIDKLLAADVSFTRQAYAKSIVPFAGEKEEFKEKIDDEAHPKYTDKVEHTGNGWLAGTYKWDRIETVDAFIKGNDLTQNVYSGAIINIKVANKITEEGKAALKGKKWVLRFVETGFSMISGGGSTTSFSTLVGDVTILRLKFETDGIVYNLGVIDNKQTGSKDPINDEKTTAEWKIWVQVLFWLLVAIIVLIFLVPLLPYIFKAVVWVISLPIKAIAAIVNAIRNKKSGGQ